jgi:putative glutamine amidotransferase
LDSRYFHQRPHVRSSKPREPRDWFELTLLKDAIKLKKPIFCICRGHQLLNVDRGGNLYQDLTLIDSQLLRHHGDNFTGEINHIVRIKPESILYDIIGQQKINCNSSHHQAIDKIGKGLIVTARSSDGIVEGLELADYPFLLSVQWHPERIFKRAHARRLFEAFVSAARAGT